MPELPTPLPEAHAAQQEIARLRKIVRALMDRAERSASIQGSDFSLFQATVLLEEQVRSRTAELEAALRENEKIMRVLRESEARFHGLVSQSVAGICIIENGCFSYTNARFNAMFGYGEDELRRLDVQDLVIDSERKRIAASVRNCLAGEPDGLETVFAGRRQDATPLDVEFHMSAMEINGQRALIALVLDVTERTRAGRELQAMQARLREQSTHDSLTGLYNRLYLEETLGRELLSAARRRQPLSVIMGDLDHFKAVNDSHGHQAGDQVLRAFGALLKQHARGSDIYCRYGGEEFLLVLPDMGAADAAVRAEQLRQALAATPIPCGGLALSVTASFGVATFMQHGQRGDELIAAADKALYAAKRGGRNRVVCAQAVAS